jgi:hypothetical protein
MGQMREKKRLIEIDTKLNVLRHTAEKIMEIWNQVDRKKMILQFEIKNLEDEKQRLLQGQLMFDGSIDF